MARYLGKDIRVDHSAFGDADADADDDEGEGGAGGTGVVVNRSSVEWR